MTRPMTILPQTASGEARYFQLMALGATEEEPVTPRPLATSPSVPELIGARRFALMAIGSLDDEPEGPPLRVAA
jgi:hypothetical protein